MSNDAAATASAETPCVTVGPAYVALCTPVYDSYDPRFVRSARFLEFPGDGMVSEAHGMLLDDARRDITLKTLSQPQVTHLLWADADMVFGMDTLKRLLSHDKAIVGGLCFERRPPYNPTININGVLQWPYPKNTLIEVSSTGGGFLLTRRDVYEAIEAKFGARCWWRSLPTLDELSQFAGDESFLSRAKACGYKVYVDTACKTGHIAKVVIDEEFVERWRAIERYL